MGGALFELRTEGHERGQLTVVSFEGTEELSTPFAFEILCVGTVIDARRLDDGFLGRRATLLFHGPGEAGRAVHGIVRRIEAEGVWGDAEGRNRYRVWLAPRFWMLGRSRNSRVFQDQTVQQIVDHVLGESHVARRWGLSGTLSPRAYCVQYEESDRRFVERLLLEEGIFYAFEHAEDEGGEETMVLFDDSRLCPPIPGSPTLIFRDSGGMSDRDEDVKRFRSGSRVRPHSTLVRHFDFLRPSLDISAVANRGGAVLPDVLPSPASDTPFLRIYDHRTEIGEIVADAAHVTERHLAQHRGRAELSTGESRCRRLMPGAWFELSGAAEPAHDGRHLLMRVEHTGDQSGTVGVAPEGAPRGDVYLNRFVCASADVRHRPRRPRRKLQQVMETATVVGPPGQEIHTDAHGRIKVQFHWDRQGLRDAHSSCWIRVMQAWAGAGWGFQFIPRVGMEVVVTFEGGDTDRPLVIGCAYNAAHPPPFRLPAEKTRSGIRTESSRGGGGHNELSFEDRKGWEQVYLQAEKDFQGRINNNVYSTVGGDSTYRVAKSHVVEIGERSLVSVGQNAIHMVGGDSRASVGGERHETVQGTASRQIGGPSSQVVGGAGSERWEASLERSVAADLEDHVGGSHKEVVGGARAASVGGRVLLSAHDDVEMDVGGEAGFSISRGLSAMIGDKRSPTTIAISEAGELEIAAAVSAALFGSESAIVRTDEASLRIEGDTLVLAAKTIRLKAETLEIIGSGSSLRLGRDIDGVAENVRLRSESDAKLELGAAANLAGAKVNLGSAAAAESVGSSASSDTSPVRESTIHLYDRDGRKLRNAPYEVSYPGYLRRGTSADGTVQVTAPEGVETVRVRWGRPPGDRPSGDAGPEMEFRTEVFVNVDSPDPDEALRRKLHNLGHRGSNVEAAAREHDAATGGEGDAEPDAIRGRVDEMHSAAQAPRGRTS